VVAVATAALASAPRNAAADSTRALRTVEHVIDTPTALAPGELRLDARIRYGHVGAPSWQVALGFARMAWLTVGSSKGQLGCVSCAGSGGKVDSWMADFRLVAQPARWWRGFPALALGVRLDDSERAQAILPDRPDDTRQVEAYLVASKRVGPVGLHLGVVGQNLVASYPDRTSVLRSRGFAVRPTLGLEIAPPAFPRTRLLAELNPQTLLRADTPQQEWTWSWGVRFWATSALAAELTVEQPASDPLAGSTVYVGARTRLGN
jgi:hypothetical protein